jgi:hypothetical protein
VREGPGLSGAVAVALAGAEPDCALLEPDTGGFAGTGSIAAPLVLVTHVDQGLSICVTMRSMNRQVLIFVAVSTLIYSLAYLIVGAIAYQVLTKQFYIGILQYLPASTVDKFLNSDSCPSVYASRSFSMSPARSATAAASVRLSTLSFRRMLVT